MPKNDRRGGVGPGPSGRRVSALRHCKSDERGRFKTEESKSAGKEKCSVQRQQSKVYTPYRFSPPDLHSGFCVFVFLTNPS